MGIWFLVLLGNARGAADTERYYASSERIRPGRRKCQGSCLGAAPRFRLCLLPFVKAFSFSFDLFQLCEQDSEFFQSFHYSSVGHADRRRQGKKKKKALTLPWQSCYTHLKWSKPKQFTLEIICSANWILLGHVVLQKKFFIRKIKS